MRLITLRSTKPAVQSIVVRGHRLDGGHKIEVEGELDYASGVANRLEVHTPLVVSSADTPRHGRNKGKTFLLMRQDDNTAMTFRVVRGVFKEGDRLEVVEIIHAR